ncbi:MAG TPA: hypothetical protein VER04_03895 [Polyangiaceae bacterium]|nr:hypothetical protein [Polyangiaceae bacterium]
MPIMVLRNPPAGAARAFAVGGCAGAGMSGVPGGMSGAPGGMSDAAGGMSDAAGMSGGARPIIVPRKRPSGTGGEKPTTV